MKTNVYFLLYLAQLFLEWEIFQTKFLEKINKHILCYEIRCKNTVETDRPPKDNMAQTHCIL